MSLNIELRISAGKTLVKTNNQIQLTYYHMRISMKKNKKNQDEEEC